jgi:diguanylate cyclase (GGDEF)-like protein
MARLEEQMDHARAGGYPLAVVMIDIDHFKHINDTHGHLAGDKVLRALADLIPTKLRASDILGRYGGEEMLAIMPGLISSSPVAVLERLRASIASHTVMHEGLALSVTASFGVTWFRGTDTLESFVGRADAALYAAKHAGRDRISYATPLAA